MTLKEAKDMLRIADMTITKRDSEYRVNYSGGIEDTAYYTDDIKDAVDTGIAMRLAS